MLQASNDLDYSRCLALYLVGLAPPAVHVVHDCGVDEIKQGVNRHRRGTQDLAKKRKRVVEYDNTYYESPLDRSGMQGNKDFPEKRKTLNAIYRVYECVIQAIDRLFQSLSNADELDASERRENETSKTLIVDIGVSWAAKLMRKNLSWVPRALGGKTTKEQQERNPSMKVDVTGDSKGRGQSHIFQDYTGQAKLF